MTDLLFFFKNFLLVFGTLLALVSLIFVMSPEKYWPFMKSMLEFKGIKGAKPSAHFYAWVRTSAMVQIALGVISVAIALLVIK